MVRYALRAVLWLLASSGLLLAGFAVFGTVLLIPTVIPRGSLPDQFGMDNLGAVYSAVAALALLPNLGLALLTWLVLVRLWPAPERSRLWLPLGLFGAAALWFPFVGQYCFTVWQSTGPGTYAATWLLVAGGAAAGLWLARVVLPALEPGCFAAGPSRDKVGGGE